MIQFIINLVVQVSYGLDHRDKDNNIWKTKITQ
jgi:hypothetical protein